MQDEDLTGDQRSAADAEAVRAASSDDVGRLRAAMLDAFDDDPLYRWLSDEPRRRHLLLGAMFDLVLSRGLERGLVHCNDACTAVAVWTPPGVELLDEADVTTFSELLRTYAPDRREPALAGMGACEEHRPVTPHWVLHSLAVATHAQGHGCGTGLLAAALERVDADGVPAALDSSNERNLSLYRRAGFRVVAEVALAAGPVMRPMTRPAMSHT